MTRVDCIVMKKRICKAYYARRKALILRSVDNCCVKKDVKLCFHFEKDL